MSRLQRIVELLGRRYGAVSPPPCESAFEHVLWEQVAYLATDAKRAVAFAALAERVGLTPQAILAAKPATLAAVARLGGSIAAAERGRRMRESAEIVVGELDGSLDQAIAGEPKDARRALMRFAGIGEPGAAKILLFTRHDHSLPLDSNGLRVLVRIGYGTEHRDYDRMYRSVMEAVTPELKQDFDWLIDAHLLLRRHGQETCRRSAPRCPECVVREMCAFAGAKTPNAARAEARR